MFVPGCDALPVTIDVFDDVVVWNELRRHKWPNGRYPDRLRQTSSTCAEDINAGAGLGVRIAHNNVHEPFLPPPLPPVQRASSSRWREPIAGRPTPDQPFRRAHFGVSRCQSSQSEADIETRVDIATWPASGRAWVRTLVASQFCLANLEQLQMHAVFLSSQEFF